MGNCIGMHLEASLARISFTVRVKSALSLSILLMKIKRGRSASSQ